MQEERKRRLQLEHLLSLKPPEGLAAGEAPLLAQPHPTPPSFPPLQSPSQRASALTKDQVRARAGQILIGFENADPQQERHSHAD